MKRNGETILNEWLVINCQIGDEQALEQLLKIWYPKLKGYAHRFIYDESLIDDVVQNTLMDMSKTLTKLKDPAAFPKWIYQILQFKCVDAIRTQTKHRKMQRTQKPNNSTRTKHGCLLMKTARPTLGMAGSRRNKVEPDTANGFRRRM